MVGYVITYDNESYLPPRHKILCLVGPSSPSEAYSVKGKASILCSVRIDHHIRIVFSSPCSYFGSLALTIYFSLGPKWMIPTLISAIVQICALLTYLAAYFPGGVTTLRYGGSMILRGGASLLPI